MKFSKSLLVTLLVVGATGILAWNIYQKLDSQTANTKQKGERLPAPVEVAAVEVGSIELLRTFTGTLTARSEFVVAPKDSGRIERLTVDLADAVRRGQVVAELDDAEYVQDVARAQADLGVEQANHSEARSLLKIAERELERLERLRQRGDISESQLDAARSEQLVKRAQVDVTQANIARAEADLEAARIRLSYTQVIAGWEGGSDERVVAERYVDAGDTVAANAPLVRIVELDPIMAVFFVTERDYAHLQTGQPATLSTDASPNEIFHGVVQRIAPVFGETTRQARVELLVENPELHLKPGMFARATVMLQRVDDTTIVPEQALTRRNDQQGVFLVAEDGVTAKWLPVKTGIRQGNKVQVTGENLNGRVVVLGQQLLDEGSSLRVVGTEK